MHAKPIIMSGMCFVHLISVRMSEYESMIKILIELLLYINYILERKRVLDVMNDITITSSCQL
jgi:hypothetical protein